MARGRLRQKQKGARTWRKLKTRNEGTVGAGKRFSAAAATTDPTAWAAWVHKTSKRTKRRRQGAGKCVLCNGYHSAIAARGLTVTKHNEINNARPGAAGECVLCDGYGSDGNRPKSHTHKREKNSRPEAAKPTIVTEISQKDSCGRASSRGTA